VYFTFVKDRNN